MNARWIKASGEIVEVAPKNGTDFQLEELQNFVRGKGPHGESDTIDIVSLHPGRGKEGVYMVVNDDGHIIGLESNQLATYEYAASGGISFIVGNVLICPASMVR